MHASARSVVQYASVRHQHSVVHQQPLPSREHDGILRPARISAQSWSPSSTSDRPLQTGTCCNVPIVILVRKWRLHDARFTSRRWPPGLLFSHVPQDRAKIDLVSTTLEMLIERQFPRMRSVLLNSLLFGNCLQHVVHGISDLILGASKAEPHDRHSRWDAIQCRLDQRFPPLGQSRRPRLLVSQHR